MGVGAADIIVIVLREVGYGSIATGMGFPRNVCFTPGSDQTVDILDRQLHAEHHAAGRDD